jgi:asparagine synthase (glutamine-hydrolysing)
MCGIFGKWNTNGSPADRSEFTRLLDLLGHRGPDASGSWFSEAGDVALGQRRLSIVDLSENANQPLHNENRTVHAVVNGEIYNYHALRMELESKGHVFSTGTDSEVVVHGWEEWKTGLPSRLNGMFALSVYDESSDQLFIARDRFGIKPLYYQKNSNGITFASELKSIVNASSFSREIDYSSFCDFFTYRYIPTPKTIWKGVSKLPPAHAMLINRDGNEQTEEYWKLVPGEQRLHFSDVVEEVNTLLRTAVKGHMLSDVPVGTFLSGGYDSTALALMQKDLNYPLRTFSMGFENWDKSEHLYAGVVAEILETEHRQELVKGADLSLMDLLPEYYDEPHGDISNVPTFMVSRMAAQEVKVVFSGEGADEIFAGYGWHRRLMLRFSINRENVWERLHHNPMAGVAGYAHAMSMGMFDRSQLKELMHPALQSHIPDDPFWFYRQHYKKDIHPLKAFQYMDIRCFMGELVLQKVDRATMAHSLEARVPFLEPALVEFMFSLSPDVYFDSKQQKPVLAAMLRPHFPDGILERKKQGFTGPDHYYQNEKWYREQLSDTLLVKNNMVNAGFITRAIENKDYWRLWKIVVMEKWVRKYLQ